MWRVTQGRWLWAGAYALSVLLTATAAGAQCWGDEAKAKGYANPALLASGQEVTDHLGDAGVRILDARTPDRYAAGHIPGAVNLPVAEITRTIKGVPGMLAPIQEVEQALGARGVTRESRVVIYDDFGGDQATRLFWALDLLGHPRVSVLQGGFGLWQREGRPIARDQATPASVRYVAAPDPAKLADLAWLKAHLDDRGVVLLDSRSPEEFDGEAPGRDVARPGHIPGAVNVDWVRNLTSTEPRQFKSGSDLARVYRRAGVTPDRKDAMTHSRSWIRRSWIGIAGVVTLVGCAGQNVPPTWDGIAYVAMGPGKAVSVVDLGAGRVVGRLPLSVEPHGVVLTPDGRRLVAADLTKGDALEVLEVPSGAVVGRVGVGKGGHHLRLSPDGRWLYVANEGSGTLAALDLARGEVVGTVRVGNEPHGVAVSPDGTRVYVSSHEDGTVSALDTGTLAVVQTMKVGAEPEHVEITPDGRWILVARPEAGELVVLDAKSLATVRKIAVGEEPHQMVFAPGR